MIDQDCAAKRLYGVYREYVAAMPNHSAKKWEELEESARVLYRNMAHAAVDATPAPIVLDIVHVCRPPRQGVHRHIYVDVTDDGIGTAVEDFRSFLLSLREDFEARSF